ncbi:MAG: mltF 2 [Steroidobacteraceae bacterium]|nr:mltF 2 [Steroidobacteraceae bacterium]
MMTNDIAGRLRGDTWRRSACLVGILLLMHIGPGCSDKRESAQPVESTPIDAAPSDAVPTDELPPEPAYMTALPPEVSAGIATPFKGDLEEMVARRLIRVGVPFNRSLYFVDRGLQRGAAYEYGKLVEDELNKRRKTGNLKVHFWFVPLPREQLLPALVDGKVDFVIGQLTVTPERLKVVDFTNPTRENVNEIVVTGPGAPPIASAEDLSGQDVVVRRSSSYHQSLVALNERLVKAGKPPVRIAEAPDNLEDDDLLEMVNAGLIRITIVDDYLARFWQQVLPKLTLHESAAVRTGGTLAVAIRKNSPQLASGLNAVIAEYGLGSAFGNTMEKRYFKDTQFVKNAVSDAERRKFEQIVEFFRKYSANYELDYLLMAAQGFQESRLDQSVKSPVGAIGVMQVMPATAKELAVGDVRDVETNIHAGVKYMRFLIDRYFKDEPMDDLNKALFSFASYNAGPARVRQLRAEADKRGLDRNVWFGNVEVIASERIGRETVTYVSNIYKYYVAYKLLTEEHKRRTDAKDAFKTEAST